MGYVQNRTEPKIDFLGTLGDSGYFFEDIPFMYTNCLNFAKYCIKTKRKCEMPEDSSIGKGYITNMTHHLQMHA